MIYDHLTKLQLIELLHKKDSQLNSLLKPTKKSLNYYENHKSLIGLKHQLKYQEQKQLGNTPHQLFMKKVNNSLLKVKNNMIKKEKTKLELQLEEIHNEIANIDEAPTLKEDTVEMIELDSRIDDIFEFDSDDDDFA